MAIYSSILQLGSSNVLSTLCLFFLFVITLAIYVHRTYYKHNKRFMELANKIPGPTWYPFIGSAYVFGTDPEGILKSLSDILDKYGSVLKVWIGPMLYVCPSEVKDIEVLLSNNNLLTKSFAYTLMKPAIGNGLLASSGDKWLKHRKALRPTFSYQFLENYVEVFNAKIIKLTQILEAQVEKHDINIFPYIINYVNDVVWGTLMTTDLNTQQIDKFGEEAKFPIAVNSTVSIILCRMFKPWLYGDFIFNLTSGGREFNSHLSFIQSSINKVIYKKIQDMKSNNNESGHTDEKIESKSTVGYLDYMLEHAVDKDLSEQDIYDECITILATGSDTIASTLAFVFTILSRRFDVQELIVEEIMEVLGTLEEETLTYDDLRKFPYLDKVIKESMRLFTTIPYIARHTKEEIILPSGYTVPNDCALFIPLYRMHRDPKVYKNPNVFDPDNFLPEKVAARPIYSFSPFSGGLRDCLGKKYAMLQLRVSILSILRRFWITPVDVKLELAGKFNLSPLKGVHLGLKKRTDVRPVISGMEHMSKALHTNIDFFNIQFKDSYR